MLELVFSSVENENMNKAYRVMPLSKSIDGLKRLIESHHVDRLQVGDCGVQGGVALYDLINCVQRIGLHSKSIARHEIKRLSRETSEDPFHGNMVDKSEEEYVALEQYYYAKFIEPVKVAAAEKKEDKKPEKTKSSKTDKLVDKKADKKVEKTKINKIRHTRRINMTSMTNPISMINQTNMTRIKRMTN